jgi:hypothetical protein
MSAGSAGTPARRRRLAFVASLVIAVAVIPIAGFATSQATHLGSNTAGHTTLDQTICGRNPSTGACLTASARNHSSYYKVQLAPGESYTTRELNPTDPVALPGRDQRRRSLLYFGQLTDFQLADEESPARVEFLDPTADQDPNGFAESAWRPQEALHPQMINEAIHQMNLLAQASPVAQGDGSRAPMRLALTTGDSADNQQRNEVEWTVRLLEGGALDPNSGSSNPADYVQCPPGTPGTAEAARYTGVQDYGDYVEGPDPDFYDPNDPRAAFSNWPRYPGLMDKSEQAFQAEGLSVPSYVALGNHDGLVQGNAAANRPFEDVATGCIKPVNLSQQFTSLQEAIAGLTPSFLLNLLQGDPSKAALVPPDEERQFVSTEQYKALHGPPFASQADGHGFGLVDQSELDASHGSAAYYSWSPKPGFRFIALNTVGEGGVVSDRSSAGNIDNPQFTWLEQQLQAASARDELIVLFGHHAINSLNNNEPDESATCTGVDDPHGHDSNPGCDVDPRSSTPLHLGEPSQRQPGDTTETLSELLLRYPHTIAYVAGHSHVNQVLSFTGTGGIGFWNIKTAAEADWPSQSRLLEVMDNRDGTLSIFSTAVDHSAPTDPPAADTPASGMSLIDLASLNREFAFNDPQKGGGSGEGTASDRNVELMLRDPHARYPRPGGASPLRVPLVPEYSQCTAPNQQHVAPLSQPSCSPAQRDSSIVTTSTQGRGQAFARFDVLPGNPNTSADEADLKISAIASDMVAQAGGGDYAGRLALNSVLRITDRANGSSQSEAATVQDMRLSVPLNCTPTQAASTGSDCSVSTTADALVPGFAREQERTVISTFSVNVEDPGADGSFTPSSDPLGLGCPPTCGSGDEHVVLRQGIFVP